MDKELIITSYVRLAIACFPGSERDRVTPTIGRERMAEGSDLFPDQSFASHV
jgi:hypothetical protein